MLRAVLHEEVALERNGLGTAPTTHSPPNRAILVRLRNIILRYPRSLLAGTSVALMNDVTRILSAIEQGDPKAAGQLLPLSYDELRKLAAQRMAQEKPGQTLQATALVHEAYLRLVDGQQFQHWNSRGHFFGAAAEAMRRILIEAARSRSRQKRGGDA